jgi:hypothetical protein
MLQRTRFGADLSFAVIAVLSCMAAPGTASASLVGIAADMASSTDGIGAFDGTIAYAPAIGGGILTITLTNTSDPFNGGFISGFVFNINGGSEAAAALSWGTHPFLDAAGQSAQPFGGPFTAGAALGGDWSGGGNPAFGIGVGETGTFVFDVAAENGASLASPNFGDGPLPFNFIVRFRGFEDGGSDKVPAYVAYHIPAPAALALLTLAAVRPRTRRRV